ncbi:hypothetical protein GWK47_013871 [Chionoecetes opilio]|uniref:Uncharacterized protein n=1 Tax=Chionoecetes opilio TaxID=41210 RepID=A0A8J4Y0L8_CHIOP|nr:hypothetical protein GWK47_013871 [Chionoecetes opilio]
MAYPSNEPEDSAPPCRWPGDGPLLDTGVDGALHAVGEWLGEAGAGVPGCEGFLSYTPFVPLPDLTAGAFSVYQQLNSAEKKRHQQDKRLRSSPPSPPRDKFVAYEQFVTRRLQDSESVDVYFGRLRRRAALFGGIPDNGLICAFCGWSS